MEGIQPIQNIAGITQQDHERTRPTDQRQRRSKVQAGRTEGKDGEIGVHSSEEFHEEHSRSNIFTRAEGMVDPDETEDTATSQG